MNPMLIMLAFPPLHTLWCCRRQHTKEWCYATQEKKGIHHDNISGFGWQLYLHWEDCSVLWPLQTTLMNYSVVSSKSSLHKKRIKSGPDSSGTILPIASKQDTSGKNTNMSEGKNIHSLINRIIQKDVDSEKQLWLPGSMLPDDL